MQTADFIRKVYNFSPRIGINDRILRLIYPYDPIVIFYVFIGLAISQIFHFRINWGVLIDFKYDIVILKFTTVILLIFIPLYYLGLRVKEGRNHRESITSTFKYLIDQFLNWVKLYEFFRILMALKIVLTIYCTLKQSIPIINPELYDGILWKIDSIIHIGFSPNLFCLKYFSTRSITTFFDISYIFWYFLKIPFVIIFIWFTDQKIRDHFFFSYFLLWMVGGLFAILFPSVGPVYKYPDLFSGLNAPHASELQKQLWTHYNDILRHPENFRTFVYEGVAAFPSLHVAVIALFCIFSKKVNSIFFVFMILYVVIIQIGSVHLGWHYAVDGYFGILLAGACYFVSNPETWGPKN